MSESALRRFRYPTRWLLGWSVLLLVALVVCLLPLPSVRTPVPHFDKLEHLLGWFVLSAYATMLFAPLRTRIRAALALLAYGVAIEGLQALVPWRSADLLDVAANAGGVLLGALLALTPAARALQRLDGLGGARA